MSDGHPEVEAALDAIPIPAPKPVDIAGIYRAALDRQATAARRWKRIAAAVSALAAGVLLLALVPKLEVRCTTDEFAVRWGTPPAIEVPHTEPTPDARVPELMEDRIKQLAALRATDAKLAALEELLLTLAVDVADRDKAQITRLREVVEELKAFQLAAAKQFDQSEKANTALYKVVFETKPKPGE